MVGERSWHNWPSSLSSLFEAQVNAFNCPLMPPCRPEPASPKTTPNQPLVSPIINIAWGQAAAPIPNPKPWSASNRRRGLRSRSTNALHGWDI